MFDAELITNYDRNIPQNIVPLYQSEAGIEIHSYCCNNSNFNLTSGWEIIMNMFSKEHTVEHIDDTFSVWCQIRPLIVRLQDHHWTDIPTEHNEVLCDEQTYSGEQIRLRTVLESTWHTSSTSLLNDQNEFSSLTIVFKFSKWKRAGSQLKMPKLTSLVDSCWFFTM
jgi:uncharacterized protein YbdZ (MbtH family)